jgi:predicted house-cleaning noncanonical NTP pyrophosphatase (MazG superfamily)
VTRYDKLVRDRIPELIEADGKHCDVRVLDDEEFDQRLSQKVHEEWEEYQRSGEITELVDLVEVIEAIVGRRGIAWADFESLRLKKRSERGSFARRLLLDTVFTESIS